MTLGSEHLGWTPEVLTPRTGLVAGATVPTVLDGGPGLADPASLASADAEGRFGSADLTADLLLEVPVDPPPGTYRGTVTVSLFSVDWVDDTPGVRPKVGRTPGPQNQRIPREP